MAAAFESNAFTNSGTVTITNGIFFSGGPTFINEPAATVINAGGVIPQGFLGISGGTFDNQGTLGPERRNAHLRHGF